MIKFEIYLSLFWGLFSKIFFLNTFFAVSINTADQWIHFISLDPPDECFIPPFFFYVRVQTQLTGEMLRSL